MEFSLREVFQLLVLFQALFFCGFLLLSQKGKRLSNRILGSLLFLIATQMGGFMLASAGTSQVIYSFNCAFGFAYGPLILGYTKSLVYKHPSLSLSSLLHLLPSVILVLLSLFGLGVCQTQVYYLYMASILIYLYLSIREIGTYRDVLKQTVSDVEKKNLSWLKSMISLAIFVFSADIIQLVFNRISINSTWIEVFELLVLFLLLVFISLMVLRGLIHPEIFQGVESMAMASAKEGNTKYASSKLTQDVADGYLRELQAYMPEKKPFLESDLNLTDLAAALGIPPRHLSQVINEKIGQNFQDYINSLRIEEAIKLLQEPKDPDQTIQEIMYDSGFSSKSAFNTAFKKKTGLTPSQYRNSL